jgi:hypothetical protein
MNVQRKLQVGLALLAVAACAKSSTSGAGGAPAPAANMSTVAPSPDPRVGLQAGTMMAVPGDSLRRMVKTPAKDASWNLRLLSNSPAADKFVGVTNSDLAFIGKYTIQGNYDGYQVWDVSNAMHPVMTTYFYCPASQSDVSVYKNLLFVSSESGTGRLDCGSQGVPDSVSKERIRGIRLFDATDMAHPKYIGNVQTCRGSHTHTVVDDLKDPNNVYIFISGNAAVRSPSEMAGCSALAPEEDPNAEAFRIEVIQVPLAHPEQAHVVSKPAILAALAQAPKNTARTAQDSVDRAAQMAAAAAAGGRGGRGGGGGGRGAANPLLANKGPQQCHDITVYPQIGLAGGACAGYGVLLDIRDPAHPKRLSAVADSNFSFWHSATFNNDGTKIIFTDEWGGGSAPRCRSTDKMEWGADAIFTLANNQMTFKSYYKMPAAQTSNENCVAHNGSLVPIPGRDIMVQGWYQGGISVFEFTDASHPKEIAFFDRGPLSAERLVSGGSWSAYWYNGHIVSSEIARGLDILDLEPSGFISENELAAARTVHYDYLNVQDQPKMVWPASFSLSRAYLDQLARTMGQSSDKIASARAGLASAERLSGQARKDALAALAKQLHTDAAAATDAPKAHKLAFSVGDLANAMQ